jgi:diguanylate cyclase (GGDEF)-like protein
METDNDLAGANRPRLVVLQEPGLGDFFEITDDATARTTISISVACCPEDGRNRQELTHAADAALYRSKSAGGNTVSV